MSNGLVGERQLHPAARAPCRGAISPSPDSSPTSASRAKYVAPARLEGGRGSSPVPRRRRASRAPARSAYCDSVADRVVGERAVEDVGLGLLDPEGPEERARSGAAWEPRPTEWTRTAAARGDCSRWWERGPRFSRSTDIRITLLTTVAATSVAPAHRTSNSEGPSEADRPDPLPQRGADASGRPRHRFPARSRASTRSRSSSSTTGPPTARSRSPASTASPTFVHHARTQGLGRSFRDGVMRSLELGADIVVNTDGDNQYPQERIPDLVRPIVERRADIVIADRQTHLIEHFSPFKKLLQRVGQRGRQPGGRHRPARRGQRVPGVLPREPDAAQHHHRGSATAWRRSSRRATSG